MEQQYDYMTALENINQLIGNFSMKRNEHEHMSNACEMIRQRLEQCDKLESAEQSPE